MTTENQQDFDFDNDLDQALAVQVKPTQEIKTEDTPQIDTSSGVQIDTPSVDLGSALDENVPIANVETNVTLEPAIDDAAKTEVPQIDETNGNGKIKILDKKKPVETVKAVIVDLDKIVLSDKLSALDEQRAIEKTKQNKSYTMDVIALNSGYGARFSALSASDINRLNSQSVTPMEGYSKLYRCLHSKMKVTSFERQFTYAQFIENTAAPDANNLLYGLYAATYPGTNSFTLTCSKEDCKHDNIVEVHVNQMVLTADDSAIELVKAFNDPESNKVELFNNSRRKKEVAFSLPESNTVIVYRVPLLTHFLSSVKHYNL